MKLKLKVVGKSTDGKDVIGGIFKLADSYGIPLETTLTYFRDNNKLVAWDVFIQNAQKAGWSNHKIKVTIQAAVNDVLGKETWVAMEEKIDYYLKDKDE